MKIRRDLLPLLLLTLVGLLVYANSLGNGFVWDDHLQIVGNRFLRSWSSVPRFFTTDLAEGYGVPDESVRFYRPLWMLSQLVDYQLWGPRAFGFHLTNLVLHLVNGLLLYSLLRRLGTGARWATLGAALFIVHPAHPETTTFIAGRVALMSVCFQLAALLSVLTWAERRRGAWLGLAGAFFAAALLSKEIAVTWPGAVVAVLLCFPDRFRLRRRDWVTLGAVVLAVLAGYFAGRALALEVTTYPPTFPWPTRVVLALRALAAYLALAVAPLRLYPEKTVVLSGWPGTVLAVAGALAAAGWAAALRWSWRRDRRLSFGLLLFAVAFCLTSNLVPITPTFADRWLYWPLAGLVIAVAAAGERASARWPAVSPVLLALATVMVAVFAIGTVRENRIWRDDITLHETAIRRGGDSARMRTALALAYLDLGQHERARQHLEQALALNPNDDTALWAIGASCAAQGDDAASTNWFARAWAARPDTAATALDLAAAQERLGEAALAEQTLRTAVDRCRDPLAPVKLANFLIRHDRLDEAETVLRQLLRREPHYALAHNSLGTVYLQRAEWAVAERELFSALAADPRLMLAHANLGVLYDRGGDWPRARAHFERARALAPDDAALRAVYAAARDRWEIAAPPSSSSAPANR